MSTQAPLRSVRIPALQRQCLFQRRQCLDRSFPYAASRPFSSTALRPYKKKTPRLQDRTAVEASTENYVSPSPYAAQAAAQGDIGQMAEDIGLLQHTIVRAPFKHLPRFTSWEFYDYFWKLLKSKGLGFYSRSSYKTMIQKEGWSRYLPVGAGKNAELKIEAKKMYEEVYRNFAKFVLLHFHTYKAACDIDPFHRGNVDAIRPICLPPVLNQFDARIAARGPLKMDWKLLKWRSARVVSHRATPLGEDQPDTAYRQAIIRLESTQSLSIAEPHQPSASPLSRRGNKAPSGLAWIPEEAKAKNVHAVQQEEGGFTDEFLDNGKQKTVVEYLVLQMRVIRGKEEKWKVWGFANESTPRTIEEDDIYWSKMLSVQAAGAA
ncbi:hypothetical protein N0V83_002621 [Neocucurbitaria cava]|uniref:Uncharacterized protein n=1 Tax=Neocucurbitaria cava TaxID=798079 RepID=A0A9W8YC57_9PLEO|nr:hypothetical protein N0V83_002621 [Neocucurbitaria cava]